jgi:hypothetical protein
LLLGDEKRKVPPGVSVFDLIMPWKNEITAQDGLWPQGFSKIVSCKKVLEVKLEDHAENVQAILMNPPWQNSFSSEKQNKRIGIEEFKK